jgi:hypothetical protein
VLPISTIPQSNKGLKMTDTKYNGWTNYATWRVNLEMFDGFEPDYEMEADDYKLMAIEYLEADGTAGIAFDYAMAFIDNVNWHEIAEAHKVEA